MDIHVPKTNSNMMFISLSVKLNIQGIKHCFVFQGTPNVSLALSLKDRDSMEYACVEGIVKPIGEHMHYII